MVDDINVYSKKLGTGRYYPVVRIPKSINDILEKYPYYYRPKPVPPTPPKKPVHFTLYMKKNEYDKWLNSLSDSEFEIFKEYSDITVKHKNIISEYCEENIELPDAESVLKGIVYCIIVTFFTIAGIMSKLWYWFIPVALLVGPCLFLLTLAIKTMLEYKKERSRNIEILCEYITELKYYDVRLYNYKIARDEYEKNLYEYNDAILNKKTNPKITNIRQTAYKGVERTINIHELTYDEISNVKKGRAECFFYDALINYFIPFDIYVNVKIESIHDRGNVYFPDFLLCSNDGKIKKIYYDIEIDEPYVQSTGEPIHCEDMDYSRDEFFSNNDVIVIRFAESQIFKNPYACVQYIIDLHNNIISMSNRPKLVRCGFKVERWSWELSLEWSKIHYRDTYAPSMSYYDYYNITYNNDNWRLISASQLDEQSVEEISEIKTVKWYSKKCLLINMKSGEQRYIEIDPMLPFNEGEEVGTINLWIETYINKKNKRMYLVGLYWDEAFVRKYYPKYQRRP